MDHGRFFPFGAAAEVVGKESSKVYFAEKRAWSTARLQWQSSGMVRWCNPLIFIYIISSHIIIICTNQPQSPWLTNTHKSHCKCRCSNWRTCPLSRSKRNASCRSAPDKEAVYNRLPLLLTPSSFRPLPEGVEISLAADITQALRARMRSPWQNEHFVRDFLQFSHCVASKSTFSFSYTSLLMNLNICGLKIDVLCEVAVKFQHISPATQFAPCRHLTQPWHCDS